MNQRIKQTISRHMPSQSQVSGHLRRAQKRVSDTLTSDEPKDIFYQAALAAACASAGLSIVRREPFASLASKVVPLAVFAYLYRRWIEAAK